jgi:hypothetical protein
MIWNLFNVLQLMTVLLIVGVNLPVNLKLFLTGIYQSVHFELWIPKLVGLLQRAGITFTPSES